MIDTLDRSRLVPTFWDEFGRLPNLWSADKNPGGTWKPYYAHNNLPPEHPNGFDCRTLKGNKEAQVYVGGIPWAPSPYSTDGQRCIITARPTPPELRTRLWGRPFMSGMLSTEPSFSQTYGYWEVKAQYPRVKGTWPAVWLLPKAGGWPPEIDVMEGHGDKPRSHFCSVHYVDPRGGVRSSTITANRADITAKPVTVGLLWTRDELVWYQNDVEVRRTSNPGIHGPMYLVIDLAVGGEGSWPGPPDASSVFPAQLRLDHARVYRWGRDRLSPCRT